MSTQIILFVSERMLSVFVHDVVSNLLYPRRRQPLSLPSNAVMTSAGQVWSSILAGSSWEYLRDLLFGEETKKNAECAEKAALEQQILRNEQFFDFAEGKLAEKVAEYKAPSAAGPARFLHKLLFCVPSNTALHLK